MNPMSSSFGSRSSLLRSAGPAILWGLGAVLVLRSYWAPQPVRPRRHFAVDSARSVVLVLLVMAVETAILYAVLRPWTYRRSLGRSRIALMIFVPWTLVSMFGTMHASNAVVIHWMWLMLVDGVLAASAIVAARGPKVSSGGHPA